MPPLRPSPVNLFSCSRRECSRWAAHARRLCGASKRCPVILAVEPLCPPCLIGQKARWLTWSGGVRPHGLRRSRKTHKLIFRQPGTVRALVGPLFLAMSVDIPLSVDMPLPIILDWLEEAEWIDCVERRMVDDLAGKLPIDVSCQLAQLGHHGLAWPRQGPRRFAIQHAYFPLQEGGTQ